MKKENREGFDLTYDDSPEAKDRIFTMLLKFFNEHECYTGESICQCDAPQVEAPDLLSSIAEKGFRFKTKYKE